MFPLFAQANEQNAQSFPEGDFKALRNTGNAQVIQVISPNTVQIDDGRILSLTGLDFPDLSIQTAGAFSITAQKILNDMLVDKNVNIYQTREKDRGRKNRMGHHIVQLERKEDKAWVQGTLLKLGLARVLTTHSNPEMAAQMYEIEKTARNNKNGLWAEDTYAVQSPESAANMMDRILVVEGRIHGVALRKNRTYLNFGENWREDFTVSIAPSDRRLFTKEGVNLMNLGGRKVRVRGWVREYNGPYMEIDHPQAIEILPEKIDSKP